MKELFNLFIAFAKVGVLTFGGGYAMLPILQREIVEKNNWASDEALMDYYAIGQLTPGVIVVNTAPFLGQKNKGIMVGIVAKLGVITTTSSFFIMEEILRRFKPSFIAKDSLEF